LLALVLALALTWYALNPAPAPVRRRKHEGERPDEERIDDRVKASVSYSAAGSRARPSLSYAAASVEEDDDEPLDWPEIINVD
jgi:hypothetical protein